MNSLSWFLYIADVLPSFANLFITVVFLGGFFIAITSVIWLCRQDRKSIENREPYPVGMVKIVLHLVVFCALLACFIPSKETIYLIAGSEAGEAVVTSETGQEILEDIQEVINHQLSDLKGE